MFSKTRKNVCVAVAGLLAVALVGTYVHAQTQPNFPGFPATGPGGGAGSAYTPFNPLGGGGIPNPAATAGSSYYPPYPYYPQYYMDPVGSYLYGSSAVIGSFGQYQMNRESAQILHQMALQKQIETAKLMFDLEKYIKDNTPTFTENQMKTAKETLKRVLLLATPGEIWNGKAQNTLLKDLQKQHLDPKIAASKIPESTLRQLNIASGPNGSLGILRDKGHFTWPMALLDDAIVPKAERDAVESQAQQLVTKALNGAQDPVLWKDLKNEIEHIRESLVAKALNMDAGPYMQAKRFLDSFDESLAALSVPAVATAYLEYLDFIKGGRTLPELIDWLTVKGLNFAPATPGDEAAYEALYTMLANYDMMFNTQLVVGKKPQ